MFLKKIEDKRIKTFIFDDEKKNKPLDPSIIELLSQIDIQWYILYLILYIFYDLKFLNYI